MKHIKNLLLTAVFTTACALVFSPGVPAIFASTETNIDISGHLQSGYRVLSVSQHDTDVRFTVYRGDYIKFDIAGATGETELLIPSLSISQKVKPDPADAPYFKMKEVGSYPFTLGSVTGRLEVVEYDRPQYETLTADAAANLIRERAPVIVDVRTPMEYRTGRLENSILIPVQELQQRYGELLEFKNADVVIYCATGNRSTVAAKILIDNGFTRVYNLRYGIYEWAQRGYQVVR